MVGDIQIGMCLVDILIERIYEIDISPTKIESNSYKYHRAHRIAYLHIFELGIPFI